MNQQEQFQQAIKFAQLLQKKLYESEQKHTPYRVANINGMPCKVCLN